jgi:hypothetical protein
MKQQCPLQDEKIIRYAAKMNSSKILGWAKNEQLLRDLRGLDWG